MYSGLASDFVAPADHYSILHPPLSMPGNQHASQ